MRLRHCMYRSVCSMKYKVLGNISLDNIYNTLKQIQFVREHNRFPSVIFSICTSLRAQAALHTTKIKLFINLVGIRIVTIVISYRHTIKFSHKHVCVPS
jgi:hypothetical protein